MDLTPVVERLDRAVLLLEHIAAASANPAANLRTMSGMATWALAEWLNERKFLTASEAKAVSSRRGRKGGR